MPLSFQIDPTRRLVLTRAYGHLNYEEVSGYFRDLRAHAKFQPSFHELVDLREVTAMGITADGIAQLAKLIVFESGAKRAMVANSDLIFGLCRMFSAYCSFHAKHNIRVFHNLEEGYRWVGVEDKPVVESLRIAS